MMGGFWKNRTHNLARMSLKDLFLAFFTYPSVLAYIAVAAVSFTFVGRWYVSAWPLVAAWVLTAVVYPFVWYILHRWVLHGQYLYRSPLTASVWKRIHFDHHQDPHNLVVLFGALYTTLPTIAIVTLPLGYLIGGPAGSAMAFGAGIVITLFYEFCHCMQHLNTAPKTAFMKRIKQLHLAHHFHNEQGNYGITNFLWDRVFATHYAKAKQVPKSATVFNIGYTEEMARKYPWVNERSNFTRGDGNPRRFRQQTPAEPAE
ncbi:MAG TPA: sterol desaturase family protein [Dongiaceae bacterium]|jgi:sterol desaturase/sphingolipid hydroxylase (fatty acid hydroxylase superfamily)|nr:sterol desaturase family protein [Dongiaceae bacterium]